MDLCELKKIEGMRHPWETVRVKVLRKILNHVSRDWKVKKILDIGCGDGFTIQEVCKSFKTAKIDAVDVNLTGEQIASFSKSGEKIQFHSDLKSLSDNSYQLITFFDVLEHINNDAEFLSGIIKNYSSVNHSKIFITVPAFNWLMSQHDFSLKHIRRYNRSMLFNLITENRLKIIDYGFIFTSLLPLRIISFFWRKLFTDRDYSFKGVGQWNHGRTVSKLIEILLYTDCLLTLNANKIGIRIPGLTLWIICEPQQ